MKAVVGSLAIGTLSTLAAAVPTARGASYNDAAELGVRTFDDLLPHSLQARQLSLPTGGPPPPPDSLPYAFGLSSQ